MSTGRPATDDQQNRRQRNLSSTPQGDTQKEMRHSCIASIWSLVYNIDGNFLRSYARKSLRIASCVFENRRHPLIRLKDTSLESEALMHVHQ